MELRCTASSTVSPRHFPLQRSFTDFSARLQSRSKAAQAKADVDKCADSRNTSPLIIPEVFGKHLESAAGLSKYKDAAPVPCSTSTKIQLTCLMIWPSPKRYIIQDTSHHTLPFKIPETPSNSGKMTCNSSKCKTRSHQTGHVVLQQISTSAAPNPSIKVVPVSELRPFLAREVLELTIIQMTGVRCPTCAANGQEVWVIPGRACAYCGTHC